MVNHSDQFAADLERAAELMRGASTEELVDFDQDSHHTVVVVDSDELEAARRDEQVQTTLARADELFERFEREGRDF